MADDPPAALLPDSKRNDSEDRTAVPTHYLLEPHQDLSWDEMEEVDRLNHDESFEAQNSRLLDCSSPPISSSNRCKSCPTELSSAAHSTHQFADSPASNRLPYYYQSTVQAGHYRCGEPMKVLGHRNLLPPNLLNGKGKLRNLFDSRSSATRSESAQSLEQRQPTKQKTQTNHVQKVFSGAVYDWLFLALLGSSMTVCSLVMDIGIEKLANLHINWFESTRPKEDNFWQSFLSYLVWVGYSVVLVSSSALFCHFVSPQAIGSGIPEMKTVLRGVYLKEYLSFRTLISKMVGLTLSLGSGLPIGKEGPFVHVASIMANLLSRLVNQFDSVYINESRHTEMLAAGCAVGVACVFSAPVGGVLFSIEVTSVYFAVRNYLTVVAFYQTYFPKAAFFPEELPLFALIGLICGFASAAFIWIHRKMVLFLRGNTVMKKIFQKHWYLYPILISILISSITFPDGFGYLLGGGRKFSLSARDFFKNCTWTASVNSSQYCTDSDMLQHWIGKDETLNVFVVLSCFTVTFFFLSALSSTIPVPSGIFGPAFTIGAAFGRIVGEIVAVYYPNGIRAGEVVQVFPGIYAVVGAAAFCGGVTHTVSVAVIVFELTGQLVYLLPVMIAVLIANAVCSYLQPSIYDSVIKIKHLPFLPDIPASATNFHGIKVEQIMTSTVQFLTPKSTFGQLQTILMEDPHLKALPVVESRENMILLGSVSRTKLLRSLEFRVGAGARQAEAHCRISAGFNEMARRCRSATNEQVESVFPSRNPSELESRTLPNNLNYYYRDRPPAPSINELKVVAEVPRNPSRFTVTNVVPNRGKRNSSTSTDNSAAYSQDRTLSDGDSEETPRTKKKGKKVFTNTVTGLARTLTHLSAVRNPRNAAEIDLYGADRKKWESEQLSRCVKLSNIGLDPAPFQLVGNTSMLKVHSLFSLLGLNRAYVTRSGRLVGVVALRDIRLAIEKVQSGELSAQSPPMQPEVVDDNREAQIRLRSMSLSQQAQLDEDAKNDRLFPRPEVISRTDTWASLKETKSNSLLLDSGILGAESDIAEGEETSAEPISSLTIDFVAEESPTESLKTTQTADFVESGLPVNISITHPPEDETSSLGNEDSTV